MCTAQKDWGMQDIEAAVARHPAHRGSLIPALQDLQETCGYLAPEALAVLAKHLSISVNEIYGVATFYTQFRFSKPARHKIQVCQGTACHVRGGHMVLEEFEQMLDVKAGEATKDGQVDLERVACLGCCALAPVITVDGLVHANMGTRKVPAILAPLGVKEESKAT